MDKKISKVRKLIESKQEKIVIELILKNYDKSNFYFALVFNEKIDSFKILYVPLDAIEKSSLINEYFCYQFVFINTVNYILNVLKEKNVNMTKDKTISNNNYIEINTFVGGKKCNYIFNDYIDKQYNYLFEIIVIIFEHSPNIVNELCKKILIKL